MKYFDFHTHQHYRDTTGVTANRNFSIPADENIWVDLENLDFTLYGSAGIHPWYINENNTSGQLVELEKVLSYNKHLILGECGLDKLKGAKIELQTDILKTQLNLASKLGRPAILHIVKGFNELISIKEEVKLDIKMAIHGFVGSPVLAEQLVNHGFYLSFGSAIFKSPKTLKSLASIPGNKFFLETDDQEKFSIEKIYYKAADIRNENIESLINQIENNFRTFNE